MKYTIEGFSQERAVELGLSVEDLVILRWFVDFWPSDSMIKMEQNGKKYGLISYKGFIEQMPIIGCNKRTVARKFQRLVEAGVLENVTIKKAGSFSVYRFGEQYESLIQDTATVSAEEGGCTKMYNGVVQNCATGLYENVHTNTSLIKTNLINTHTSRSAVAPLSASDKAFDCFWVAYPRKTGKIAARKAWDKIKPNAEFASKIIKAVENQTHWEQWTAENGRYIPLPATWLNQGRWDDEKMLTPKDGYFADVR